MVLSELNSEMATPNVPSKGRRKSGIDDPNQYLGRTDHKPNTGHEINTEAAGVLNPMIELIPTQVVSTKSLGSSQNLCAPKKQENNE